MPRQSLHIAAAALIAGAPASLAAQDNAIGPPSLRDFSLPGVRTTPPAPVQPTNPPPAPVDAEPEPAPRPQTRPEPRPQTRPAPAQPAEQAPALAEPDAATPAPPPAPVTPAPTEAAPPPPPESAPEPTPVAPPPAEDGNWLLWSAIGSGALALLVAGALLARRRRAAVAEQESRPIPVPPPPPAPPPPPLPQPRIEVEFRPERLVTTEAQAAVHFDFVIRNHGDAVAHNLRIEARLFNASGSEAQDVESFFAGPLEPAAASAGLVLAPGRGAQLTSSVAIPRDRMRPVALGGRPFFIPTVAIKIVHDDGNGGAARNLARHYLVGIAPRESEGKLGPFRMDLGPRIYRALGQREIDRPAARLQSGRLTLR